MQALKHVIDANSSYRDGTIHGDFDCTLNQTDISSNSNKFYIMQVIHHKNNYVLFIRYGRVGERGRIDETPTSVDGATSKFIKQFKLKTGNNWDDRAHFATQRGKYTLCEMDYEDVVVPQPVQVVIPGAIVAPTVDAVSKLKPRVQEFLRLVGDVQEMKNAMVELEIDVNKMPLGKISQKQINTGYGILNQIIAEVQKHRANPTQESWNALVQLSSQYYTLIPFACGRGSAPPVIDTPERIQRNIETLDDLSNIRVAAKVVQDSTNNTSIGADNRHPLDRIYTEINTKMRGVKQGSHVWNMIQTYITNTHATSHSNYSVELLDIYKIARSNEKEKHLAKIGEFGGGVNRQLLWHGTRLTNYISILKGGLLLRPDVIPGTYITGKMFGYGIYAANSFSKSFNYTGADRQHPVACLFLGEFALGNCLKKTQADSGLSGAAVKKAGCHSTWGQGQYTPSSYSMMKDGVLIPSGKLEKSGVTGAALQYDEFIVYDQDQFHLRYIVAVKGRW